MAGSCEGEKPSDHSLDRRTFLRAAVHVTGLGALGVQAGSLHAARPRPSSAHPGTRPTSAPQALQLTAAPLTRVFNGTSHEAWALNGSLPGPALRFDRGSRAEIELRNELAEPTILHWHGLDVPEEADGHPRLATGPGETYRYDFEVVDRSGLYWYHPHTHERTGAQTYAGLAGLLIVRDEEEEALPLPSVRAEIPLVLQDRRTTSGSPFAYRPGMGPDMMVGHLGDTIFANGEAEPNVHVTRGAHRLRLLNACNARLLDIGLSNGQPMTLIGSDGGLLESATQHRRIMIGTGERLDLLVDFSSLEPGERVTLRSFPFEINGMMSPDRMRMEMGPGGGSPPGRGRGGMGRGRMGGEGMSGLPQGADMDMVHFVVTDEPGEEARPLPSRLSTIAALPLGSDTRRRTFRFDSGMMRHAINGRSFEMGRIDHQIRLGTTEVWRIVNETGLAHPVHVHAGQFRVLSRTGSRGQVMPWEQGLKDTVLVLPQETVEIAVRFDRFPGVFLMHCHNLEHEDAGMMMNFQVLD
ncbi:MAG: multicopper oxidase domain-containing protein [Longimicrobiales bacterium]|nr:multicopper oxidase domain-containing protein [Longimicrobiales bacterium]